MIYIVICNQVKEKYPNVIPFEPGQGDGLDVLYSAFAEEHSNLYIGNRAVPQGDQLTSIFKDPVYRESMQYISRLYRERLHITGRLNADIGSSERKSNDWKFCCICC